MAADVMQVVESHLRVIDEATGPLKKIVDAAGKAGGIFGRVKETLSGMVPMLSGVGMAYGVKELVHTTEEYLGKLKEVRELTGATASETDFMFSSARKAGVEYGSMQQVMFQLSRRGSMMAEQMAAMGKPGATGGMSKRMQRLGVDITKGPVAAIEQMAASVKKGTLSTDALMSQFRIPQRTANDFKQFLEGLDSKQLDAIRKSGGLGLVTDKDVDAIDEMEDAQHRINDAWNRTQVLVGAKLIPVLAKLTDQVAAKVESWLPAAQKFGDFLARHMDAMITAALTFAKIMAGVKIAGMVGSVPIAGPALKKGLDTVLDKFMQTLGAGLMVGMKPLAAAFGALKLGLAALAPIAAAVVGVVLALYLAFKAFQSNAYGIRDRIVAAVDSIKARLSIIASYFTPVVDVISSLFAPGDGIISGFVGMLVALPVEAVLKTFDFLLHVVQTVLSMGGELGEMIMFIWKDVLADGWREYVVDPFMQSMKWLAEGVGKVVDFFIDQYNLVSSFWGGQAKSKGKGFDLGWLEAPVDMWTKHWNKTQKDTDAAVEAAKKAGDRGDEARDKKPPAQNFDFRGSRFDITQNFAEGFDPDRIAVAFSQDLASLADTRVQSGFAPVFAVR